MRNTLSDDIGAPINSASDIDEKSVKAKQRKESKLVEVPIAEVVHDDVRQPLLFTTEEYARALPLHPEEPVIVYASQVRQDVKRDEDSSKLVLQ